MKNKQSLKSYHREAKKIVNMTTKGTLDKEFGKVYTLSEVFIGELYLKLGEAIDKISLLESTIKEYEALFNLQQEVENKAIKLWQEETKQIIIPDRGKLIMFLLNKITG